MELVLSVAFDTDVPWLDQLGFWRDRAREQGLTTPHDQPPLLPAIERFGAENVVGGLTLGFGLAQPSGRIWFMGEDESHLLQAQSGWVARNWRSSSLLKPDNEFKYEQFEKIRDPFIRDISDFSAWLNTQHSGFTPTQCEVTYIDHITPNSTWETHADIEKVLRLNLNCDPSDDEFLPKLEDARATIRYTIEHNSQPIGRLHVEVQPAFRSTDLAPIIMMNLTARGRPLSQDIRGVGDFLDLGHNWVVRGFTELTTSEMHKAWKREA